MSQCPKCGLQMGLHHSILPGCLCTTAAPFTYPVVSPQREWVGLSVFEINDLVENTEYEDYRDLVKRTEAKLKEKNT